VWRLAWVRLAGAPRCSAAVASFVVLDNTDSPLDAPGLFDEIQRLTHQSLTHLAERTVGFEGGFALRTSSLPLVWTLNQVRLARATTAEEVAALADQHQDGLPFRHVVVEGEHGAPLVEPLTAAGFWSEREVVMAMTQPIDRAVDTSGVVELTESQMLQLMREWLLEERAEITDEGLEQVVEYSRREGALFAETRFGIIDGATPLAITKLRTSGRVAWLEDVYTTASARGRGFARALLAEAVTVAWVSSPSFAFIIADDDDWPKELYGRVGFAPVGFNRTFHRGG